MYSYDKNGNLTKKDADNDCQEDYICEYEYEYDANGYLIMKKETKTFESALSYITQFLYTNDENGRPISAELIETEDGKNSYASQILTYNYETLYFYNAE